VATDDVWATIRGERESLATDLAGLNPPAWDTPSWCADWSVRDVVAHLTASSKLNGAKFVTKIIGSGFSLKRLQAKDIAAERGGTPDDTLARFRAEIDSKGRPPGPIDTILGETIVHSEDIRRPLGIKHPYPTDAVIRVADFYKGSNLILGTKRRIEGLSLEATDADWRHGTGPTVSGPMINLVMAMTGRKPALDELSGDGVATLAARD
jgi:uncharacterized protein (TIGR03083 family)